MNWKPNSISPATNSSRRTWLVGIGLLLAWPGQTVFAEQPSLSFTEVQDLVQSHFAAKPGYKAGDLITVSDVRPVLLALRERGLNLSGSAFRQEVFLPDNHLIAQLMQSGYGRQLMREMADVPNFYDRLYRLSTFEAGQQIVQELFAREDAVGLRYLCSAEGARQIVRKYGHLKEVANFDFVSGQVYTAADFVDYLETVYVLSSRNLGMPSR